MTDDHVPILAVYLASGIASVTDLRKFRIPNGLNLALIVSGLGFHLASAGLGGLGRALLGALFAFSVLIVLYALGGMGAADVKFLAGVGSWLGVGLTKDVMLYSALACGVYSIVLALATGRLGALWAGSGRTTVSEVALQPDRRLRLVPIAPMVAVGVVATVGLS